MTKFYSQHGEDIVVWSILRSIKNGKFVDVGSMDGVWFSNSLSLEQEGWSGLCIEAHPFYHNLAVQNRPKAICVHAAVAECDKEEVEFYANKMGMLSTLNPAMVAYFKNRYAGYTDTVPIKVPQLSLNTILSNNSFGNFDFLSIDVEGEELNVLKGLDLTVYTPRIIVSEAVTKDREVELKQYLAPFGYAYAMNVTNNMFFSKIATDIPKLKKVRLNKDLLSKIVKTKHPLK